MGQDCTHMMEEGIQLNVFHFYSSILEVGFTIQRLDMCTKKHYCILAVGTNTHWTKYLVLCTVYVYCDFHDTML